MSVYEGNEPYIFISYAHKDAQLVMPIVEGLQERGFRVWYDKGIEIGKDWGDYIAEHIQRCGCFVPFISQNSLASTNCKREIGFANDEDKPFIAIHLEECELSAGFRFQLNAVQAIFYYKYSQLSYFLDELTCASSLLACKKETTTNTDEGIDEEEIEETEEVAYYRANFPQLQRAALQGDADACFDLARCYDLGVVVEQNDAQAFYWYRQAAEYGDEVAQYNVGLYYLNGWGVKEDSRQAVQWFRESAQQGDKDAQFMLGECYEWGWGVVRNHASAVMWYQEAALQKHREAQYRLGLHYEQGRGVRKDLAEAARFYLQVANASECTEDFVVEAQFRLAEIYNRKASAQYSPALAKHWYKRASMGGHQGAQEKLETF